MERASRRANAEAVRGPPDGSAKGLTARANAVRRECDSQDGVTEGSRAKLSEPVQSPCEGPFFGGASIWHEQPA